MSENSLKVQNRTAYVSYLHWKEKVQRGSSTSSLHQPGNCNDCSNTVSLLTIRDPGVNLCGTDWNPGPAGNLENHNKSFKPVTVTRIKHELIIAYPCAMQHCTSTIQYMWLFFIPQTWQMNSSSWLQQTGIKWFLLLQQCWCTPLPSLNALLPCLCCF